MNFDELYDDLLAQEVVLHNAKRNDYTGGGDPLANYKAAASGVGLELWQVLLSRLYEKAYRLRILMGGTQQAVGDETIRDTCLDMSVIAKLLAIQWALGDEEQETSWPFNGGWPDEQEAGWHVWLPFIWEPSVGTSVTTTNVTGDYQLRLPLWQ